MHTGLPPLQSRCRWRCSWIAIAALVASVVILRAESVTAQICWANIYRRFPNFPSRDISEDNPDPSSCVGARDLSCVVSDYTGKPHTCCFPQWNVSLGSSWTNSWQCCQTPIEGAGYAPGAAMTFACPSGTSCWSSKNCGDYDCCLPGEVPLSELFYRTTGEFAGCHTRCCPVNHVLCPGLSWSLSVITPAMGNSYCCSNARFCDKEGFCREPGLCDPVCWGSDLLSQLPSASWPSVRLTLPSTCTAAQRERAALQGAVPANTKASWNCPTFGGLVASQSRSSTCSPTTKKWTEPKACPGLLTVMSPPSSVGTGSKPLVFDPSFVKFATDFFKLAHDLNLRMDVQATIRQVYQELVGASPDRDPYKAALMSSSHYTGHAIDVKIYDIAAKKLYGMDALNALNPAASPDLPVSQFITQLGAVRENNAIHSVRWGGYFIKNLDGVHFDDGDGARAGVTPKYSKRVMQVQTQLVDMCSDVEFLDATTGAALDVDQFGSTICTGDLVDLWQMLRDADLSSTDVATLIRGAVINFFPTLRRTKYFIEPDVYGTSTSNFATRRLLQAEEPSSTGSAGPVTPVSFIAARRGSAGTDVSWSALLNVTDSDFDVTITNDTTDATDEGGSTADTATVTVTGSAVLVGLLDAVLQLSINGTTAALQAYAAQWTATKAAFDLTAAQQLQGATTGALGNLSQAVASLGIVSYGGLTNPTTPFGDDEYNPDAGAPLNLTASNFSVTWPPWCPSGPAGPIDLTSASVQVNDTDVDDLSETATGDSTGGDLIADDSTGSDLPTDDSTGDDGAGAGTGPPNEASTGGGDSIDDSTGSDSHLPTDDSTGICSSTGSQLHDGGSTGAHCAADLTANPPSRAGIVAAAALAVMAAAMIQRCGA